GTWPLPSLQRRDDGEVVGSVRRGMVTLLVGEAEREIEWARRVLPGQPLASENNAGPSSLLGTLPPGDTVTPRYLAPSSTWVSVTPVVLPGYDDPAHYRRRLACGVGADEQKNLLA